METNNNNFGRLVYLCIVGSIFRIFLCICLCVVVFCVLVTSVKQAAGVPKGGKDKGKGKGGGKGEEGGKHLEGKTSPTKLQTLTTMAKEAREGDLTEHA